MKSIYSYNRGYYNYNAIIDEDYGLTINYVNRVKRLELSIFIKKQKIKRGLASQVWVVIL